MGLGGGDPSGEHPGTAPGLPTTSWMNPSDTERISLLSVSARYTVFATKSTPLGPLSLAVVATMPLPLKPGVLVERPGEHGREAAQGDLPDHVHALIRDVERVGQGSTLTPTGALIGAPGTMGMKLFMTGGEAARFTTSTP
jgi:hypothetical protein